MQLEIIQRLTWPNIGLDKPPESGRSVGGCLKSQTIAPFDGG